MGAGKPTSSRRWCWSRASDAARTSSKARSTLAVAIADAACSRSRRPSGAWVRMVVRKTRHRDECGKPRAKQAMTNNKHARMLRPM
eukprot:2390367-Alexandrium_andersonii.AAC.1